MWLWQAKGRTMIWLNQNLLIGQYVPDGLFAETDQETALLL